MSFNRFLLFFLYIIVSYTLVANNTTPESIIEKVDLAMILQTSNPDSALKLGYEILEESRKIGYTEGIGYAYVRIGSILNHKEKNDSAVIYLKKAISIRQELKDRAGEASIIRLLGYIYRKTGKLDSAFASFYQSIRILEELNDSSGLIRGYLELANSLGDYEELVKAKQYYDESFGLAIQLKDSVSLAYCYQGYGRFFFSKKEYNMALENYLKAASMQDNLGRLVELSVTYNNIAVCYENLGQLELAISFYQSTIQLYNKLDYKEDIMLAYYNLGITYSKLGIQDSSIYYLKKSKEIASDIGNLKIQILGLKELAEIFAKGGEFMKAYENHKLYMNLSEELLNSEKISSISEMQTKYDTEKKEQQIVLLDEQNKTKEAQRNFLLAAAAALLLVVFVLGFFFVQRKRIAEKNELIAAQKIESLLDEQEIKTYNAMLEGQEEERMRIATDLHDRLGSMLSTVKLLFSALDDKIDQNQAENKKQYETATHLLDEACVEVRRVSHNLGTGMVANFGLFRALEELCESIHDSGKLKCSLQTFGIEEDGLKINVEVGIYRMVQEVFNNTMKYAKAKNLTLQVNHQEEMLSIMIEDDGIGFNLAEAKEKGGMGLSNLEMRSSKLGGTLHIDTQKGRGTTSIIEIPIAIDN